MKTLIQLWAAIAVSCGTYVQAQHMHSVPHTTTHVDSVQHGNHFHNVPLTTTHFDNVFHGGSGYLPHTTTHFDAVPHNGHVDLIPHTTTHLHPTYPTYPSYPSNGAIINSGSTIYNPPIVSSSNSIPATAPTGSVSISSLKPNVMPYTGRGVKIILPQSVGGEVDYLIDGQQSANIQSGQEQLLSKKGSYEIRFSKGVNDQGRDFGMARYNLTEGTYRFAVTANGWDIYREREVDAASEAPQLPPNSLKKNALPSSAISAAAMPSVAVPSSPAPGE